MLYTCKKCGKEFTKLTGYKNHLKHLMPCVQPSDLEIIRDEFDRIIKYVKQYEADKTSISLALIKRKCDDLYKFHRNLADEDKKTMELEFLELIDPLILKLKTYKD